MKIDFWDGEFDNESTDFFSRHEVIQTITLFGLGIPMLILFILDLLILHNDFTYNFMSKIIIPKSNIYPFGVYNYISANYVHFIDEMNYEENIYTQWNLPEMCSNKLR